MPYFAQDVPSWNEFIKVVLLAVPNQLGDIDG
jgi:hypothetical protein